VPSFGLRLGLTHQALRFSCSEFPCVQGICREFPPVFFVWLPEKLSPKSTVTPMVNGPFIGVMNAECRLPGPSRRASAWTDRSKAAAPLLVLPVEWQGLAREALGGQVYRRGTIEDGALDSG
jgi:hypothetical protein